jgi:hypothetical protein
VGLALGIGLSYVLFTKLSTPVCETEVKAKISAPQQEAWVKSITGNLLEENSRLRREISRISDEALRAKTSINELSVFAIGTALLFGLSIGLLPFGITGVRSILRAERRSQNLYADKPSAKATKETPGGEGMSSSST